MLSKFYFTGANTLPKKVYNIYTIHIKSSFFQNSSKVQRLEPFAKQKKKIPAYNIAVFDGQLRIHDFNLKYSKNLRLCEEKKKVHSIPTESENESEMVLCILVLINISSPSPSLPPPPPPV